MKKQTAKLVLLAAFLFGAIVLIRVQEERPSYIGLAAEHSSDHGSDIGCGDLQSCCRQGGGVYCAYTDRRVGENERIDEKCCNSGESCSSVSILGIELSSCNAANDKTCPKKCPGKVGSKYENIERCCKLGDDCGTEKNHGAPVCYQKDLSACPLTQRCEGESRILRTNFKGLNVCCDVNSRCAHNTGAAVCVGDPKKGCKTEETRCDSDPSKDLGSVDEGGGYFLCCGGDTPICVPGRVTSNGRPHCVRRGG